MENLEIKTDLYRLIDSVNDLKVLEAMKVLLKSQVDEKDFWDYLPEQQKRSIERGLEQAENGETKPHEEVMKKYEKWFIK
jgi:hypothetical protein